MVAFALEKGALAVAILILAKILGAPDYGRLTLAQGMVNTAQIFIILGAGTILARYIPAMLEESFQRAVEVVNLCALMILATASAFIFAGIAGSATITTGVLGLPAQSSVIYWILVWVVLAAVHGLLFTIMLSLEEGRVLGIVSLASALALVVVVPLAAARWGFHGAVVALAATNGLKALLLLRFYVRLLALRGVNFWIPARRSDLPLLLSFGVPVFLSSALWAPTMWLAQIILKHSSPTGLASVGVFGFCNNILGLVILMSSITNRAAFPILSSLKARGDRGETRKFIISILAIQVAAAIAVGTPLAFFAPQIMAAMGPDFVGGAAVLLVMVAAGLCISGQQPLINLLLVNDKASVNLIGMAIWSASLLSIAFVFVNMGALGIAIGVLAAAIIKGLYVSSAILLGHRRGELSI
ncbi:oligosaccharide flippase family protein [Altererythrobacter sp. C41]|uniref:oligosaccharide flippase family protein n=1 Tax=Altererythrobacter sp. C41 TaxID=2806021 RepID=UPI0019346A0E|nr:oligosaccharide flippase family protein [Altererythrobacter sp. C41]MBM0171288.1 oligosaccharide flippase family protein [Altererythrobacter sp. C41]